MAAAITFLGRKSDGTDQNLLGSGLGFYGPTFGSSVQVGQYQDSMFITDGTGQNQGPQVNNTKFTSSSGVELNGLAVASVQNLPNISGTLNIRFTFDSPVKTQNAQLFVYDRVNKNNPASGVTPQVAELIHTSTDPLVLGSGDALWIQASGSGAIVDLVSGAGTSGTSVSGVNTVDAQHDWYVAMSASPNSIGSKTQFGLFVQLEFL